MNLLEALVRAVAHSKRCHSLTIGMLRAGKAEKLAVPVSGYLGNKLGMEKQRGA